MGERFVRCPFCGRPHEASLLTCPVTGQRLDPDATAHAPLSLRKVPDPPPSRRGGRPSEAHTAVAGQQDQGIIGQILDGKYVIRSVLGEGGMGAVYEAEHVTLARPVAVKVLHPQQARKSVAVKRFHQEARAAGAIGHPNICEVYDLGTLDDGSPYLVMERLLGRTLADRIAHEGGLPFDDVIDIVSQVLAGLAVAHDKGIVHRDIKPENIFLCERPGIPTVVKLLDFGVSKMMSPVLSGEREEEMDLTRTGMVMGTPFYMSPEQARGDRDLDGRLDLFACGVILYEAITGRRPFLAANYNALLLQILTSTPKPMRELRPGVPPALERIAARALERDRGTRYQKAAEFQRDLLALRERPSAARAGQGSSVQEMARQAYGAPRPPTAPRSTPPRPPAPPAAPLGGPRDPRHREAVPPPVTPSSVDIPVGGYEEGRRDEARRVSRESDRPMEFGDDGPTEVTSDPRFYEEEDIATRVRSTGDDELMDAVRALRSQPPRPAAGTQPPPRPAAGSPPSRRVPPPPPPGAKLPAVGGFGSDDDTTRKDNLERLEREDDPTTVIGAEEARAKLRR